jgi:hypothetical protein
VEKPTYFESSYFLFYYWQMKSKPVLRFVNVPVICCGICHKRQHTCVNICASPSCGAWERLSEYQSGANPLLFYKLLFLDASRSSDFRLTSASFRPHPNIASSIKVFSTYMLLTIPSKIVAYTAISLNNCIEKHYVWKKGGHNSFSLYIYNVMHMPIATQRLGKHIPEAYALNNRTSITR